mgnify:CR=1 FL=1
MDSRLLGAYGEQIAARHLRTSGYKIKSANYKTNVGEIDIIAKDNKELVFVEVKTRASCLYGQPKDAVDITKKKHIYSMF